MEVFKFEITVQQRNQFGRIEWEDTVAGLSRISPKGALYSARARAKAIVMADVEHGDSFFAVHIPEPNHEVWIYQKEG